MKTLAATDRPASEDRSTVSYLSLVKEVSAHDEDFDGFEGLKGREKPEEGEPAKNRGKADNLEGPPNSLASSPS